MQQSPDAVLRDRIISVLKEKGYIVADELLKLEKKYSSGNVSAEDWIMHVESSLRKGGENAKKN